MKKILSIVGARPQFIKHAPVQIELQKHFHALTIHTGQHYDPNMSDIFFKELKMPHPEFRFDLSGKTHGEQTAQMILEIEKVALSEKPVALLVYGDTNSTLAGALVASKSGIPLIHIEAGLRSFNKSMPEEVNRVLTDHVSDLLFSPSDSAIGNLAKEGIYKNVYKCGDVMKDMLELSQPFLTEMKGNQEFYFATIHRPYNTDDVNRMRLILNAFQNLDKKVIFAIHPRTKKLLADYSISLDQFGNIHFIDPVGYFDSLSYQNFSQAVITDSGGMQKEAYWLKKRCITLRSETEWVETIEGGWNTLCFEDLENIQTLLTRDLTSYHEDLYGSGNAAKEIVDNICCFLNS